MQGGIGFSLSGITGTMAAALASGSPIFAARYSPTATLAAYLTRLRVQFQTLTAFTTPVTAGRRLELYRGSAAATTGGTALTPVLRAAGLPASGFSSGAGGDARIATTASLGGSPTWEATPFATYALSHVGASGGAFEVVEWWELPGCQPFTLKAGELIGIRAGQNFDAAGTFQLAVSLDGYER